VPPVSPASQVASGSPTDILRVSTEAALSAAIKAASARARILLHPGTYRLPLLIDKELVIEGDGKDRTAVRIEVAEGSALEFRAERGRVANLSLCQTRGGLEAAVAIRKGELTLENCCIESNGVGISVWGPDTKPNLCGNRVWRCEEGVVFSENAEGALEGGEVCLNRRSGVIIREGARPSIRRVSVYGNGHVGILIQSASGTIERNPIFENGREGIMVHGDGASPTITGNSIAHNVKAGIYLCDQVTGEVTENTVELNQNSGIAIRQHGNPSITRNVVRSNNGKGVWAADQAAGTVKDNDLRGNYYGDWWKSKDSSTCFEGGNDRVPDQ
jgi:parallel beta-helix repeat protein